MRKGGGADCVLRWVRGWEGGGNANLFVKSLPGLQQLIARSMPQPSALSVRTTLTPDWSWVTAKTSPDVSGFSQFALLTAAGHLYPSVSTL